MVAVSLFFLPRSFSIYNAPWYRLSQDQNYLIFRKPRERMTKPRSAEEVNHEPMIHASNARNNTWIKTVQMMNFKMEDTIWRPK